MAKTSSSVQHFNNDLIDQINSDSYIKTVTELGDTMELMSSEDIRTRTLHKLVAKGTKIDSTFYDKLIQHKLLKPIDRSLLVTDGITTDKLVAEAMSILNADRRFNYMFMTYGDLPVQILRNIYLEAPIALKMTIIKQAIPRLFKHSIEVALIALYIGLRENLKNKELSQLVTAGVLHDISELHITPELQDSTHSMSDEDWAQIYAHPVLSFLILREFPSYHPTISQIVLEHHEKLDGSGYPRAKRNTETCSLGHVLSVSEAVAGLIDKGYTAEELDAKLKMCQDQYNQRYIHYILEVLKSNPQKATELTNKQVNFKNIDEKLTLIGAIIDEWEVLRNKLSSEQKQQLLIDTLDMRLKNLRIHLIGGGFDTTQLEEIYLILGDDTKEWLQDTNSIIEEALFQIHTIIAEVKRNWPEYKDSHKPRSLGEFLSNWMNSSVARMDFK